MINEVERRSYPAGSVTAHLVGYLGRSIRKSSKRRKMKVTTPAICWVKPGWRRRWSKSSPEITAIPYAFSIKTGTRRR